jgi:tetratricopeptide (TPR) repeat protein
MKHLIALLVLSTFGIYQTSHACINEFATQLDGKLTYTAVGIYTPHPVHDLSDTDRIQTRLKEMDSLYKATGNLEYYNNYGVQLIYLGKFEAAKAVLMEIERKQSGLYQIATNLGTIYEVLGKNDSALIWIKKGLERNPDSHHGSEWIHVKILEAKIKKQDNWQYLSTHSLLGLDFGNTETPTYKGKLNLRELAEQIEAQLSERISFIPPKDPIIAQLCFDLGNAVAIEEEVESALEIYALAEKYGYDTEVFQTRKTHFKALNKKAKIADEVVPIPLHKTYLINAIPYAIYGFILLVVILVYWVYRRRNKQRKP